MVAWPDGLTIHSRRPQEESNALEENRRVLVLDALTGRRGVGRLPYRNGYIVGTAGGRC